MSEQVAEKVGYVPPQINTLQDIFNAGYKGVVKQGGHSIDFLSSRCIYLDTENDRRCVFGHTIPDRLCREGYSSYGIMTANIAPDNWNTDLWKSYPAISLCSDIQHAHDRTATCPGGVETFKARMAGVAKTHKLEVPTDV